MNKVPMWSKALNLDANFHLYIRGCKEPSKKSGFFKAGVLVMLHSLLPAVFSPREFPESPSINMRVCIRIKPDEENRDSFTKRGTGEDVVVIGNTIAVRHKRARRRSSATVPSVSNALRRMSSGCSQLSWISEEAEASTEARTTAGEPASYKAYNFENIFCGKEAEEWDQMFNRSGCADIVNSILYGGNGFVISYGHTRTGKSHTVDNLTECCLKRIFGQKHHTPGGKDKKLFFSVFELYKETVHDLLSDSREIQVKSIKGVSGVSMIGLTEQVALTLKEAVEMIQSARKKRKMGTTSTNQQSSRSHLFVRIEVSDGRRRNGVVNFSDAESQEKGVFTIVDLAGKDKMTNFVDGEELSPSLRETASLNRDLLLLGSVVKCAVAHCAGKPVYVPFRNTKLTRILSQALIGNDKCLLIGCINTSGGGRIEHSLHTLDFCNKAKQLPGIDQIIEEEEEFHCDESLRKWAAEAADQADEANCKWDGQGVGEHRANQEPGQGDFPPPKESQDWGIQCGDQEVEVEEEEEEKDSEPEFEDSGNVGECGEEDSTQQGLDDTFMHATHRSGFSALTDIHTMMRYPTERPGLKTETMGKTRRSTYRRKDDRLQINPIQMMEKLEVLQGRLECAELPRTSCLDRRQNPLDERSKVEEVLELTDIISEVHNIHEQLVCLREESRVLTRISGTAEGAGVSPLLESWMEALCSQSTTLLETKMWRMKEVLYGLQGIASKEGGNKSKAFSVHVNAAAAINDAIRRLKSTQMQEILSPFLQTKTLVTSKDRLDVSRHIQECIQDVKIDDTEDDKGISLQQLLTVSRDALLNFQSSFGLLEADLKSLGEARALLDTAMVSLQETSCQDGDKKACAEYAKLIEDVAHAHKCLRDCELRVQIRAISAKHDVAPLGHLLRELNRPWTGSVGTTGQQEDTQEGFVSATSPGEGAMYDSGFQHTDLPKRIPYLDKIVEEKDVCSSDEREMESAVASSSGGSSGNEEIDDAQQDIQTLHRKVLELWESLGVSWMHRLRFAGDDTFWDNNNYCVTEIKRLEWIREQGHEDPTVTPRDKRALQLTMRQASRHEVELRQEILKDLSLTGGSHREIVEIYKLFQIDPEVDDQSQQLLDRIWKADQPVAASIAVCQKVLHGELSHESLLGKKTDLMMNETNNTASSSDFKISPHYQHAFEQEPVSLDE